MERVLVTHDKDLLAEGMKRQQTVRPFAGIVYASFEATTTGKLVRDLELVSKVLELQEMVNQIEFLPW